MILQVGDEGSELFTGVLLKSNEDEEAATDARCLSTVDKCSPVLMFT